jgi:MFS family permease
MKGVRRYLGSLRPDIPRDVRTLQLGGLLNSFGNGLVLPFLIIYLHNVRGISLPLCGLIVGTNSGVSLIAGPASGPLIDRLGGRRVLRGSLLLLALGFGGYAFVHEPWQGFLAAGLAGLGNGGFWPAQSTLLAGLSPQAARPAVFALQRVFMNLGIGLGGLAGGLIATTSDPRSFDWLFAGDAATFVVYMAVLARVPDVHGAPGAADHPPGTFRDVLRHRAFMSVIVLNLVLITFGLSQIDVLPAYMKNHAGVSELGISLVFAANTALIVVAQLPIAATLRGRRRMWTLAAVGVTWGACWLAVPVVGGIASGASATALFCVVAGVLGVGECLHGTVQAPLVTDLAERRLLGRYMALSAFSWSAGFGLGPALGGFLLARSPVLLWVVVGGACLVAGATAPLLERTLPAHARRTPRPAAAAGTGGD